MNKHRFTIARRLILGFGILILVVAVTNYFTYRTLSANLKDSKNISDIYSPSLKYLNDIIYFQSNAKMLIKLWVHNPNTSDRNALTHIIEDEYPKTLKAINELSDRWDKKSNDEFASIIASTDSLLMKYDDIMDKLETADDYKDSIIFKEINTLINEDGDVILHSNRILDKLYILYNRQLAVVDKYNSQIENSFQDFQNLLAFTALMLVIVMIVIGIILARTMVGSINYIKDIIIRMGRGNLPDVKIENRSDEIGEMADALKVLITGLKETSNFALQIGEGNFESEFKPLSENDILGNSLILMRKNLIKAEKEAELRKLENYQRSWASQGIAEFGEVLRQASDNLEELASIITSKLVRYLEANLGGLFIVNDSEPEHKFLELAAFYAYERQKFVKKQIEIGENLVGQCYQENETIYLTDIPEGYVHITSGLGEDDPKSLLIVPLKANEEIYGIVELASFKNFEPYQIDFVEKIGETIASTIATVKINIQTSKLLAESHEKSERLAKQEEEVRKNIEKMQAGLDEVRSDLKREKERYSRLQKSREEELHILNEQIRDKQLEVKLGQINLENTLFIINNSMGYYELNQDGFVITANSKFLKMADVSSDEFIGHSHSLFIPPDIALSEAYQKLLPNLIDGISYTGLNQYVFNEKSKWLYETFTPIKDEKGNLIKIVVLSSDYTQSYEKEKDLTRMLEDARNEIEILKNR